MTKAEVRVWHEEEGWGVIDSEETPGGCWVHFSAIEMSGFHFLSVGDHVTLEWEAGEQDGFQFRAVRVTRE
ncbi:cold-shock protein [Streptomyces sp. NBC_01462]|uniref:cold-shock protein n=1 Tax=Streptomyces sp. NBC_01462 TaxID=2903876 RepID=UPI002E35024E|nr:cold shock domain-containing protein [Streptomyces sp. NBC_01462]